MRRETERLGCRGGCPQLYGRVSERISPAHVSNHGHSKDMRRLISPDTTDRFGVPRQERPRSEAKPRPSPGHTRGGVAPVSARTSPTCITVNASLRMQRHHRRCESEGANPCR